MQFVYTSVLNVHKSVEKPTNLGIKGNTYWTRPTHKSAYLAKKKEQCSPAVDIFLAKPSFKQTRLTKGSKCGIVYAELKKFVHNSPKKQ